MAKTKTLCFLNKKPLYLPEDAGPEWATIECEFASTAYSSGDIIQLATLPEGYKCLDWFLSFPDIDSNATPTLAWSLGISNASLATPVSTDIGTEVWGSGLTAGQSSAIVRNANSVSAQGQSRTTSTLSGNRELVLKCTTAAATYAGSDKVGHVMVLLQG